MRRVVTVLTVLAITVALARADDQPAWQATLGDLAKKEKAGYGSGLSGVVVDPATGTVWINLSRHVASTAPTTRPRRFVAAATNNPRVAPSPPVRLLAGPGHVAFMVVRSPCLCPRSTFPWPRCRCRPVSDTPPMVSDFTVKTPPTPSIESVRTLLLIVIVRLAAVSWQPLRCR